MSKQKIGGSSKKFGRNKKWCEIYSAANRKAINKLKKVRRHYKNFPQDIRARSWITANA